MEDEEERGLKKYHDHGIYRSRQTRPTGVNLDLADLDNDE
jgi:hypothetical protein